MKQLDVAPGLAERWFEQQCWTAFPFQREVWQAVKRGKSGLLHATTGSGKTYAVWMAALARSSESVGTTKRRKQAPPLTVLWITPMRVLAADTERALRLPLQALDLPWTLAVHSTAPNSRGVNPLNRRGCVIGRSAYFSGLSFCW